LQPPRKEILRDIARLHPDKGLAGFVAKNADPLIEMLAETPCRQYVCTNLLRNSVP